MISCLFVPDILLYHVVSGTFYSAGLMDGMMVPTLEGKDVEIHMDTNG